MTTMPAPTDRSFVAVGGAGDVLAAAVGEGSPHAAARRLRDMAPTLDVTEARAAAQRDGHGVVIATHEPAALAVRWFAPGAATAVHDHGCWGAAVVVDGHNRYERFELRGGRAALDATFWLEPGDVVSWQAPPGDVHRHQAADGGALRSFRALPTADGCVVEVEVRARRGDDTVQWRALHVLRVRDGKVAEHVTYCSGHWDAATIAAHAADTAVVRP
jgi:predicted metal-dependent enzyme (double-stranded beta helix superfamily)